VFDSSDLDNGIPVAKQNAMVGPHRTEGPCHGDLRAILGDVTLAEVVHGHPFLVGLRDKDLAILTSLAEVVEFGDNEIVLTAGERSQYFYLLLSGSISVELPHQHYTVTIQGLGAGDAFGWSVLLPHQDTLFQIRTRERCAALRLDGVRLSAALRKDPRFAADMLGLTLRLVAGRMQATETRLGEMCGVRVKKKGGHAAVQSLNKLIEVCLDGELGYRTAAEHINDTKLQIILSDFAIRRSQFAKELQAEVERLGGNPVGSGSMSASLHRGWIALKSVVFGGSSRAILSACETGEHAARASYEATAHWNLSGTTRLLVESQCDEVEQARVRMRQIHDQLASEVE
jgi:uncharacterized protein (TIGR02284 family)